MNDNDVTRRFAKLALALATVAVFLGLIAVMAAPRAAAAEQPTITVSWWMKGSAHGETTWPQPRYTGQTLPASPTGVCYLQVDVYRYATPEQKAIVDGLGDELTLVNGQPEDSAVYLSHTYKEVPCLPLPTPTASPSQSPTPSPSVTSSESATPVPTQEPSTPAATPTSETIPPAEIPASSPPTQASTTVAARQAGVASPELAATGWGGAILLGAAIVLVAIGTWAVVASRRRKNPLRDWADVGYVTEEGVAPPSSSWKLQPLLDEHVDPDSQVHWRGPEGEIPPGIKPGDTFNGRLWTGKEETH